MNANIATSFLKRWKK